MFFPNKIYVVGSHRNGLIEAILMNTHNKCSATIMTRNIKISLKWSSYQCLWTTHLSRWQAIKTQTFNKYHWINAWHLERKFQPMKHWNILLFFFFWALTIPTFWKKWRNYQFVICWIFPVSGNGKRQTSFVHVWKWVLSRTWKLTKDLRHNTVSNIKIGQLIFFAAFQIRKYLYFFVLLSAI